MREQHVTVLGQCQYTRPNRDTNGEDVMGPVVVWECAAIRPTVANGTRTPNIFLNGVGRFAAALEIAQLYKR